MMPVSDSAATRLLLIQMPWAATSRPSIALGILEQLCEDAGVTHDSFYYNLDTRVEVGLEAAALFADNRELFGLSEHLFAVDLFGAAALHSDTFLEAFSQAEHPIGEFRDLAWLRNLRDLVLPVLLEKFTTRTLEWNPTVVGFTATFNQVMASLALAARLKRAQPQLRVICGGACFDGEMGLEYHRTLPNCVDHVFIGEAEAPFREFLARLTRGRSVAGIPGISWWEDGALQFRESRPLANMNESPMPDYRAYFKERARVEAESSLTFPLGKLPFESSRGCWWGQKNHCVFCGLNPEQMEFRSKSVDRTIDEIVTLCSRHQVTDLMSTDWILSRKQRKEIFRRLADLRLDVDIFFETRADMNKEEILMMSQAGVRAVQPGIESFSTPLLQLMRKNTQGIRQVQFLRWCREAQVEVSYNLLAGFPGDRSEWYLDMSQLIQKLHHLEPPRVNVIRVELHRFSPLFNRRNEFGITRFEVRSDYQFNFPEGLVDLQKAGYFFEFESEQIGESEAAVIQLRSAVAAWIESHRGEHRPAFYFDIGPGFVKVVDTRCGIKQQFIFEGIERDILLLCDEVRGRRHLLRELESEYAADVKQRIEQAADNLIDAGFLMSEGELLLTLPVCRRPRSTTELRALVFDLRPERTSCSVAAPIVPAEARHARDAELEHLRLLDIR